MFVMLLAGALLAAHPDFSPAPVSHPLYFEQAMSEVVANDPRFGANRATVKAAFARATRSGAGDRPMLEFMLENVPVKGGFDMDPMTMRTVALQQRMPWPGARGHAKRAGLAEARAISASAADAYWNRLALAWRAYAAAYWAGRRAEVARDETSTMDRMAAAARARYESGRGRLEEILRVEASRVTVQADLADFEAERAAALADLAAYRGRMSDSVEFDLEEPWGTLAPDSSMAWSRVLLEHPRLRAIQERESSARSSAAAAKRMVWPELVLRASYSTRSALDPITGMPADDMWGVGVGVELPIGVAGREGAMAREMSFMAEVSAAERSAEVLAITRDLAALRAQARAAARTKTLYSDTLVVIERKALAASWSAYEAGKIDLVTVFEAAHSLYTEELEASRAGQSFADALARLLAASGSPELVGLRPGTWSPRFAREDVR